MTWAMASRLYFLEYKLLQCGYVGQRRAKISPKEGGGAIVARRKESEPRSSASAIGVRGADRSAWPNSTLPPVL